MQQCSQLSPSNRGETPGGLIRYTKANAMANQQSPREIWRNAFRPRVLVYLASPFAIIAAVTGALVIRVPLKLDVNLDRGVMLREVAHGMVENVYRLHITNTDEHPHHYRIVVSGIEAIVLSTPDVVALESTSSRSATGRVRAAPMNAGPGANPIKFEVIAQDDNHLRVSGKAVFLMPRNAFPHVRPSEHAPAR